METTLLKSIDKKGKTYEIEDATARAQIAANVEDISSIKTQLANNSFGTEIKTFIMTSSGFYSSSAHTLAETMGKSDEFTLKAGTYVLQYISKKPELMLFPKVYTVALKCYSMPDSATWSEFVSNSPATVGNTNPTLETFNSNYMVDFKEFTLATDTTCQLHALYNNALDNGATKNQSPVMVQIIPVNGVIAPAN